MDTIANAVTTFVEKIGGGKKAAGIPNNGDVHLKGNAVNEVGFLYKVFGTMGELKLEARVEARC